MLCPICKDGFLCEPIEKPLVVSYRGFSKTMGTSVFLSCSNCLYASTEPLNSVVDIDFELSKFKKEINRKLSIGDLI